MNMNCKNIKKMLKIHFLALLVIALPAGPSFALTYNLAAVEAVWTTPDTATPVAMWAFIEVPSAADYNCNTPAAVWDVGPVIDVPAGEDLTINLRNCLPEPVSIFIPGQAKNTTPVTFTDGAGRTRVSSFDYVIAPNGSLGFYTWNSPKEGTDLYQSGTFVAKQVPKGLYGGLVVRGPGYPAVAQEAVLVYSEIDPDLNNAAAGAGAGARVNNYQPRYFLINGDTYPNTENIVVGLNQDVLLRFVNGGLQTYVPTLQGLYMSVIAEDGNLLPNTRDNYQIELTAAKTMDAIVNLGAAEGRHALYDRSLHLSDGTATNGGMLTFIQTQNNAPVAVDDAYQVKEGQVLNVADIVVLGTGVLVNDTDADGDSLTAFQTGTPPLGALVLNTDGSFTYTPVGTNGAVESFQYFANDGTVNSNIATVTITVIAPNVAPVANDDSVTIPRNVPATINILANDVDSDGTIDPTSVALRLGLTTTRGATVAINPDGTIDYDPTGTGGGPDYFYYTVNDTELATSNEARVRINRVRDAAPAPASSTDPGRVRRPRTRIR
jgi:FtsP/CotA-like multicopper oxidase with cupredoxin domain